MKKNVKVKKSITVILSLLILIMMMVGCIGKVETSIDENLDDQVIDQTADQPIDQATLKENPMIQIEMADGGIMVFELYTEYAPKTVANFVELIETGFYDGLTFHRIIKGFMAQSGDPNGDGTGGSGVSIEGEFSKNGFDQNTLVHTSGVISMARSSDMDSASSQFFIMDGTSKQLDGSYAAFGKLVEGEETLAKIANTEVERNPFSGEMSSPVKIVAIKSITVIK